MRRVAKLLGLVVCLALSMGVTRAEEPAAHKMTLNSLELRVDGQTGSVVYLSYPATGTILQASSNAAGLLDVAYPTEPFPPMRLASRFSGARIAQGENGITITWKALGPSRNNFPLPRGNVSAQATIRAAPDGRSVILQCRIDNNSAAPVPQILFPDLWGLKPLAGDKETELRLPRGVVHPFIAPFRPPESAPPFYENIGWREYPAGGYYAQSALRWLDYGNLKGGLSIFERRWGTADRPNILTYRSEADPGSLRLAWEHRRAIEPGQSWESGEFWLTPHPGGWAKGIEVFRAYVTQANLPRRLPEVVRDGLGFQTIWMTQDPERDPARAYFRFEDLPRVARDAREHGINQLVPWFWCSYFRLPIRVLERLGTMQEFVEGVRQAEQLGVDVAPFVSVHIIRNPYVARYGVQPGHDNWTYHPELIPQFRPSYLHDMEGILVDDDNKVWQEDVLAALTEWIDRGISSLCWDQFLYKLRDGQPPELIKLVDKVRNLARVRNPESTFGSESGTDLELDSSVLDYTWNWLDYVDAGPILNVLRSPRLNCNIDSSPLLVKKCFADGLYLNIMPSKVDQPNGTALISEYPALSAAVKEVSGLRKQFLPFFVEGTFIGNSVLRRPAPAFVHGYQLRKQLLVIVLNDQAHPQRVTVQSNLDLWLPSPGRTKSEYFNGRAQLISVTHGAGSQWTGLTPWLRPGELGIFEIQAQ